MIRLSTGRPHVVTKDSPNSRPSGTERQIHSINGAEPAHPLVTEEVRVVCEDADWRVEHNRVRNVATSDKGYALRIVPTDRARIVAVIIPVLLDGRLLLVRRYHYAIGRWSLEFPRWFHPNTDDGWRHLVEESLRKEIGLTAVRMSLLGALQIDLALVASGAVVILAEGCTQTTDQSPNPGEWVDGELALSFEDLDQLVRSGEISCGITLAALYLHAAQGR